MITQCCAKCECGQQCELDTSSLIVEFHGIWHSHADLENPGRVKHQWLGLGRVK